MTTTVRISITDESLLKKILSIPKTDRGRVIQRALEFYLDTEGGREVYRMISKETTEVLPQVNANKSQTQQKKGKLKEVLGDF